MSVSQIAVIGSSALIPVFGAVTYFLAKTTQKKINSGELQLNDCKQNDLYALAGIKEKRPLTDVEIKTLQEKINNAIDEEYKKMLKCAKKILGDEKTRKEYDIYLSKTNNDLSILPPLPPKNKTMSVKQESPKQNSVAMSMQQQPLSMKQESPKQNSVAMSMQQQPLSMKQVSPKQNSVAMSTQQQPLSMKQELSKQNSVTMSTNNTGFRQLPQTGGDYEDDYDLPLEINSDTPMTEYIDFSKLHY